MGIDLHVKSVAVLVPERANFILKLLEKLPKLLSNPAITIC